MSGIFWAVRHAQRMRRNEVKVTTKTFIDLEGTSVSLGELRRVLLDYGDERLLRFHVNHLNGYQVVRLEIV